MTAESPGSFRLRADKAQDTPLDHFSAAMKPIAIRIFLYSGLINLLALATTLYLWQVFDRVLTSQSKDTLYFLTLAAIMALLLSVLLEGVRQVMVSRIGSSMAARMGPELLSRSLEQRLASSSLKLEALRELSNIKNFATSPAVFHFLDAGWMPIYLLLVFGLHFQIGVVAVVGGVALAGLAWLNDRVTRPVFGANQVLASANMQRADALVRNAEVIDAMGMGDAAVANWSRNYDRENVSSNQAQEKSARIVALSKFVRGLIQVILLMVGALLVLDLQVTGGALVASSVLVGKLLSPLEAAIGNWRTFVMARNSYRRLQQFLSMPMLRTSDVSLPAPSGRVSVSRLTYIPQGMPTPVLRNVSFELNAGESLAIIGPSASGKTTLARLLVGVLMPTTGSVRLDGAETFSWKRDEFGQYCGYLPQDIELFPGTVFSNIARFKDAASEDVIEASRMAGCHELILHLPGGYDMPIGEDGSRLSGGQRQRIGLARALFGKPRLVVLDEPNSNLDAVGETALITSMQRMKEAGATVVVVAHRTSLLQAVDKILVLQNGRVTNFGPPAKVLADLKLLPGGTPEAKPAVPSGRFAKSITSAAG